MARFFDRRFGGKSSVNPTTVALEDGAGTVVRYRLTARGDGASIQFFDGDDALGSAIALAEDATVTGPSSTLQSTGRLSAKVTFDTSGFRDDVYVEADIETVSDREVDLSPWAPALGGADGDIFASDGAGGVKLVDSGTYQTAMQQKASTYWLPAIGSLAASNLTLANQTLYVSPVYLPGDTELDQIGVYIASAGNASAVVRLGVYDSDGTGGRPSTLLAEAASTVAADSTGDKTATLSLTASGLVWVAAVAQGASSSAPATTALTPNGLPYSYPNFGGVRQYRGYLSTGVSGALPATFGSIFSTASIPLLGVRAA